MNDQFLTDELKNAINKMSDKDYLIYMSQKTYDCIDDNFKQEYKDVIEVMSNKLLGDDFDNSVFVIPCKAKPVKIQMEVQDELCENWQFNNPNI